VISSVVQVSPRASTGFIGGYMGFFVWIFGIHQLLMESVVIWLRRWLFSFVSGVMDPWVFYTGLIVCYSGFLGGL
jgi:hypothetical protein